MSEKKEKKKLKVGVIQIDGKWANLALMKLSAWHKKRGDEVTLIDLSTLGLDRIYGSKIFVGGSGFDIKSELPQEIELEYPDYELFKMSKGEKIGFSSRGCIRSCEFCIVREKEGYIHETPFDWATDAEKVLLLDNNFLASPMWKEKLEYFIRHNIKVCFTQGNDIRLVNDENAELLSKVKYYNAKFTKRRLYFAFDWTNLEPIIREKVELLKKHGIPPEHLMFYVLCGFNTTLEEDLHRINVLIELGCLPYVMLYNQLPYHRSGILKKLARWINRRYYTIIKWEDFDWKKTSAYKKKDKLEGIIHE